MLKTARGRGIASRIIQAAEQYIYKQRGSGTTILAEAQVPVIPLYSKLGFTVDQSREEFLDEGNPHRALLKTV